jgi:hypothetical protein
MREESQSDEKMAFKVGPVGKSLLAGHLYFLAPDFFLCEYSYQSRVEKFD